MIMFRILLLVCILGSIAGCFTPKAVHSSKDRSCHLVTRELKLELNGHSSRGLAQHGGAMAGSALLIIPPRSFIVSGSIVAVGNIVHWVEKTGKCDSEKVERFTAEHNGPLIKNGGTVIKPKENFA